MSDANDPARVEALTIKLCMLVNADPANDDESLHALAVTLGGMVSATVGDARDAAATRLMERHLAACVSVAMQTMGMDDTQIVALLERHDSCAEPLQ